MTDAERIAQLEQVRADALLALPVLATVLDKAGCFGGARIAREMLERAHAAAAEQGETGK
jgi:hypothetical protein